MRLSERESLRFRGAGQSSPRLLRNGSPTPTPAADHALAVPRAPCSAQVCGGLSGPLDVLIHPWAGARAAGARGFESSRGIPVFSVGRCGLARDTPSIFRLLRSFLSSIGKGPPPPGLPGAGPTPSHVSHRGAGATPSPALGAGAACCTQSTCVLRLAALRELARGRLAASAPWQTEAEGWRAACLASCLAPAGLSAVRPALRPPLQVQIVLNNDRPCQGRHLQTPQARRSPRPLTGANSDVTATLRGRCHWFASPLR